MNEPDRPQRPSLAFFTRLFGQSFIVVWGAFWLLALFSLISWSPALEHYCSGVAGCRSGLTEVALVGVISSLVGMAVCFFTRHRTAYSPARHASLPWLVLAVVAAVTVGSVPILMP
ncbi:Hypothetical protein PFCIRM513_02410 [Propionibacterium freudenreichii]|uniref:hypothetical protein n=1 Tax=Propionibacterium freudenreichii TaxID=1744 RepID=UPI0005A5C637|nr:hypothetical protein [Propionibacterium freudenreichii]MDK9675188.1 hypothetical protein [Propionibacterium freudenreichii]CEI48176.1 Hypothetical protein PFCIRM513_02410 [Propionibacterium freudenreichii]SCQ45404.1 Hypothetical protein PFR_JS7-1_454 [Propionibacterium freudenreichii]SCQ49666.1 Hypothetical protein PFR_JS7-2_454 [Propionibacterium freudenreichii]